MLIGLIGKKRVGKDTVANYFVSQYGFVKYQMAQPIKKAIQHIFGWSEEFIEASKEVVDPRYGLSPRQVLQHLGNEWAQYALPAAFSNFEQTVGRTLWSTRFRQWYQDIGCDYDVVVSDVRYPHEVSAIQKENGVLMRIDRETGIEDNHESEVHIDSLPYNYWCSNNSSIVNLQMKADYVYNQFSD